MARSIQKKYISLYQFQTTQVAAGSGVNWTVTRGAVPADRMVSRVFLRVRSDLVISSSAAKLAINSSVARRNLFNALVSSISMVMPGHPLDQQFVQAQGLGELVESHGRIGIMPTCPQLFGEGQYYGEIAQAARSAVTPAATNGSHFITLEVPLIDQRFPGVGNQFYLGGNRLDGLALTLTMGALTFTDLNSNTITFPDGTGGTAGVTSVELVAETFASPDGGIRDAWPPQFSKIPNGTTPEVILNPVGGAIAAATVRIPTLGANDSVDYLTRNYAFTSATGLTEAQETSFTPLLFIDGVQQSDVSSRGFEYIAGIDLINAQTTAVATAHQLRATDTSTVGDGYNPPSFYRDSGVPLVWNAPDSNFFEGLSFGQHRVLFNNLWASIGNRDIYCVIFPVIPGGSASKVMSEDAVKAGRRAGSGVWDRILSILPGRN
jgi:hypothetical protein